MSENWEFYPCAMEDTQAFIMFDDGISEIIDKEAPENLVLMILKYKEPDENGLPTQAEYEVVSEIEDVLSEYSEKHGSWYVGRVTVNGLRIYHIFTNQSNDDWQKFAAELCEKYGYEIKVTYKHDPEHTGYWEGLYPTEDDRQVINDMKVIDLLTQNGDDLSAERTIDHWVYFDDEESAKPFIDWAISESYTYEEDNSHETDEGEYGVQICHNGTPELYDITYHTITLNRKAAELGGRYDGWGTVAIKPGEE